MSDRYEAISAFLDDEPFDANELAAALADPSGRTLLIDMVALRHIVQPDDVVPASLAPRAWRNSSLRALTAAAAIVVALLGGYFAGQNRNPITAASEAPAPTRVVQGPTSWTVVTNSPIRSAQ